MTATQLLNMVVDLTVTDPWAFGTECGDGPFRGKVIDTSSDALAIRLEAPLRFQGMQLVTVIVRPRHTGESTDVLITARRLAANLLFLTSSVTSLGALKRSEDGVAAIGTATV